MRLPICRQVRYLPAPRRTPGTLVPYGDTWVELPDGEEREEEEREYDPDEEMDDDCESREG